MNRQYSVSDFLTVKLVKSVKFNIEIRNEGDLSMNNFVIKEYLSLKMPSEDFPISDHQRILLALNSIGYENIQFPLSAVRKLYPLCRNAGFDITVTLVHREYD